MDDAFGQVVDRLFVILREQREFDQPVEPVADVPVPEVAMVELQPLRRAWELTRLHRNPERGHDRLGGLVRPGPVVDGALFEGVPLLAAHLAGEIAR